MTSKKIKPFSSLAPYQLFFPIGILSSLLAVGVWFVQNLNWFSSPALLVHSKLIMGGFLWSFITGFLMTAVPKMTGTRSAHPIEIVVALSLVLAQILQSWNADPRGFYTASLLLTLFIVVFAGRRVVKTQKKIPMFFSHVGIAMVLALLGAWAHFNLNSYMGLHLYHVGAVLLLVLGIGARFFSFLSGLPSQFEGASKGKHAIFHGAGLSMAVFLYLAGRGESLAYLGLGLVSLFYMVFVWQVFRMAERPSALKIGLRVVALMIPTSFFMCWLQPDYYIAWLHLLFIGAFGLITYAVATRVVLAHGSYSLDLEMKSPALKLFVSFLGLGMTSRVLYGFSEGFWQTGWLHLAATFWILAICCWCYTFSRKILMPGEQAKAAC